MQHKSGFTLIELMITIAIAAILITIAVPGFQSFISGNRMTTLTNELVTELMVAKAEAVRRNASISICIKNNANNACNATGAWQDGWLSFTDSDADGVVDAGETVLKVHGPLPRGYTLGATGLNAAVRITYLPSGNVNAPGTYTLCQPGAFGRTIAVTTTGRTNTTRTSSACP